MYKKLQRVSAAKWHFAAGIILLVFVSFHLFNHALSIYGPRRHITVMNVLRRVYRNPFAECVLLLAVVTQIFSGIILLRSFRRKATTGFEKLQMLSGFYLALFCFIHVGALFYGRFLLHLDTNFYFGVAGLNTFPFSLFFIPYYALAILSFFGHIAAIHSRKMKRDILGWSPRHQSILVLWFGLLLTLVVFYGSTNRFKGFAIPPGYEIKINASRHVAV